MQMFLQKDWLDREPGETWTEHLMDTIRFEDSSPESGTVTESAYLVLDIKTDYTHQGQTDTLGYETARISYRIVEMNMSGSVVTSGSEATIESTVTGSGLFYYHLTDHLQVAARSIANVNMVVGMPGVGPPVPMEQQMAVTMSRKPRVQAESNM